MIYKIPKIAFLICFLGLILSCSKKPSFCENFNDVKKIKMETLVKRGEYRVLTIDDNELIDFFNSEICSTEPIHILGTNGEIWTIKIILDDKFELTLAKYVDGRYYFRDKNGKYINNKLAIKLADLMDKD